MRMIVKDVLNPERIKLEAKGKVACEICYIEMTFSKDALRGFSSNLLWIYEDYDRDRKIFEETLPLGKPVGNQVFGFYITTNSPTFVVHVENDILKEEIYFNENKYLEMVNNQNVIEISAPLDDDSSEEFERNYENIISIKVYDENHRDITQDVKYVTLQMNYEGLRNLGIALLDILQNYKDGLLYEFEQFIDDEKYENRVILAKDSIPLKLRCEYLGKAYDYEHEFWR